MKSTFIQLGFGVLAAVVFSGCHQETPRVEPPADANLTASNQPAAAVPAKTGFEMIQGRWERPDGGYVLEVRKADAEGKLDAGYFNPDPIKVSQARAYRENGDLKMFVELRDVNYPGCTYKLTYDGKSDQLFGQYYQASQQQTYDVTFGRVK